MKIILNVVFLLTISYSISAQQIPDLILTKEQNEKWFNELEQMDFANQLPAIKNRVLQDTCVYINETGYCGMFKSKQPKKKSKDRIGTCYKPLLIFDGEIINNTSGSEIVNAAEIAEFLDDDKIREIKIIRNVGAAALYGSSANSGAILFSFKDKESLGVMKNILANLK
jgi:hypothetical protein